MLSRFSQSLGATLLSLAVTSCSLENITVLTENKDKDSTTIAQASSVGGLFSLKQIYNLDEESGFGSRIQTVDLTGNGSSDLFIHSFDQAWILSGTSLFLSEPKTFPGLNENSWIADQDGDGLNDHLSTVGNRIAVRSGQTLQGSLTDLSIPGQPAAAVQGAISIPDISGDGQSDVIISYQTPSGGSGRAAFTLSGSFIQDWASIGTIPIGRWNSDSKQDFCNPFPVDSSGNFIPRLVQIHDEDGTLLSSLDLPDVAPGSSSTAASPVKCFAAGDQNGDGRDDIMITGDHYGFEGVALFYAGAGNTFQMLTQDSATELNNAKVVEDYNQDGRLDFLFFRSSSTPPFNHTTDLIVFNSSQFQTIDTLQDTGSAAAGFRTESGNYRIAIGKGNSGYLAIYEHAPAIDSSAPTANLQTISNTVSGTITLTATASDPQSGVSSVEFWADDVIIGTDSTAPYSLNWNTQKTPNGLRMIRVIATNATGLTRERTQTVTVNNTDSQEPAVEIIDLQNNAQLEFFHPFSVDVQDNHGIDRVEVEIGGGNIHYYENFYPPVRHAINIPALLPPLGAHTLTVRAIDYAGNTRTATRTLNVVDTTPPIAEAPDGEVWMGRNQYVRQLCSDYRMDRATLKINGQTVDTLNKEWFGGLLSGFDADVTPFGGSVSTTLICRDEGGNETTVFGNNTIQGLQSTGAPSVVWHDPEEGEIVGTQLTARVEATTSGSPVPGIGSIGLVDYYIKDEGSSQFRIASRIGPFEEHPVFRVFVDTRWFNNGNATVKAIAYNRQGSSAEADRDFIINYTTSTDSEPPTGAFVNPQDGDTVSGIVNVEVSATDNEGIAAVTFYVNGESIGADASAPYTASWNTAITGNGGALLQAVLRDTAGNETTLTANVTVGGSSDTQAPSTTLVNPVAGGVVGTNPVVVEATATDNVFVSQVEFFANGASIGIDTSAPYQANWTPSIEGTNMLAAIATDPAGNTGSDQISVTVDAQPPTGFFISPASGIVSGTIDIVVSATDNVQMSEVEFEIGGVLIDVVSGTGPTYTTTLNTGDFSNGGATLRAHLRDHYYETTIERDISIQNSTDTTAPQAKFNNPQDGDVVSDIIVVGLTISDASPITDIRVYANGLEIGNPLPNFPFFQWNTALFADGQHVLTAAITDSAGNVGNPPPITITTTNGTTGQDLTPPSTQLVSPSDGSTVNGNTILQAVASDDSGTVTVVRFLVDGTVVGADTTSPYTFEYNFHTPGTTYVLTSEAEDPSGNIGSSPPITVSVPTTPGINITEPADGAEIVPGLTIIRAFASSSVGVSGVEFFVDGNSIGADNSAPYVGVWDSSVASPGTHTLLARVTSTDGGQAEDSIDVSIPGASSTPTIAFVTPVEGATISGSSVFTWTTPSTPDGTPIDKVDYYINGTFLTTDFKPGDNSWVFLDTTPFNGIHQIEARATAGSAVGIGTVTVDIQNSNQAPELKVFSPQPGERVHGTEAIWFQASDDNSIQSMSLYANGQIIDNDTSSPFHLDLDTSTYNNGDVLNLRVVASDGALEDETTFQVTVDHTGPQISFQSPEEGVILNDPALISAGAIISGSPSHVKCRVIGFFSQETNAIFDGSQWNCDLPALDLPQAYHSIRMEAQDSSGNTSEQFRHIGVQRSDTPGSDLGIEIVQTSQTTSGRLIFDWLPEPGQLYNIFVMPLEIAFGASCRVTTPGIRYRLAIPGPINAPQPAGTTYMGAAQPVNADGTPSGPCRLADEPAIVPSS